MNVLDVVARPLRRPDTAEDIVRAVHGLLQRRGVAIPTRLWNGVELGPLDAPYRVVLRHPWSLRVMLVPPTEAAAGEAYLFGDIDVEGSLIAGLHHVAVLREDTRLGWARRAELARALLSLPRPPARDGRRRARLTGARHTRERDEQAVRFHYDVGNDFYRLVLDDNLVYSCAYFSDDDSADPADDPRALDRAQVRKLDMICRKLRLRPGRRLLDIGCGWGALVIHAARHYGVEAVGITLSSKQASLARQRAEEAGVAERVDVRVEDYRDTTGSFDAVASVGMFEHVGEERFGTYFARAHELTARGGLFLNHAITTGSGREVREMPADGDRFIGRYVFPDGALAPAHVAVRHMEQAGFELVDVQQMRRHYARTLRHWLRNLEGNADAARTVAGDVVYRTWRAYMSGSVVGFERNNLGVVQVLGVNGDLDLPLERTWVQPTMP